MDTVFQYFSQNIERVSKEEILGALKNALLAAQSWREACLLGFFNVQEQGLKGGNGTGRLSVRGANHLSTDLKPFELGSQIVATPGALEALSPERLLECLARHARGDWGDVCPEDAELNNRATHDGTRILSAYPIDPAKPCKGHGDNCLWVLTSACDDDGIRESTCVMLPEEY